jgi:hypothetical protein
MKKVNQQHCKGPLELSTQFKQQREKKSNWMPEQQGFIILDYYKYNLPQHQLALSSH